MKNSKLKIILLTIIITSIFNTTIFAKNIGKIMGNYYSTDILAYIDDQEIKSYNIGGTTLIPIEDLENYGFLTSWDNKTRTVKANSFQYEMSKQWSFFFETEKNYNNKQLQKDGFIFEASKIFNGETFDLKQTNLINKNCLTNFSISSTGIWIGSQMNEKIPNSFGDNTLELFSYKNSAYGSEKIDTPELRANLKKLFRFYVNDKLIGLTFEITAGNGHTDYLFTFDYELALDKINTIRLEIGEKSNLYPHDTNKK